MSDLASLDINSLYGPNHDANTAAYCEQTKIEVEDLECTENCEVTYMDSPTCDYFQTFDCATTACAEIGVKYLDHIVQQSWDEKFNLYSATYNSDGWYTEGTAYDLSAITTKISAWYVMNDSQADEVLNSALIRDKTYKSIEWNIGQDFYDIPGAND